MLLINFKRIAKFSFQNFYRNIWLSLVTLTVIVLTLFSLTSLIVLNATINQSILTIKNKIDISLYFSTETTEEQVGLIRENISKYNLVKEVKIISPKDALEKFKKLHEGDELVEGALKELGENPLGSTLTVKAHDVKMYPQILAQLKKDKIDELVQEIDYDDNKVVIAKLETISKKIKDAGLVLSVIFALISLLVVFNTVRVGIYTHREEIGIMKLVGASNWFVRMPFLLEGVIYAFLGTIIFWIIFYIIAGVLQPIFSTFFVDINFNLMSYLVSHFLYIFGFELILIIILNSISSLIATSKYLKV